MDDARWTVVKSAFASLQEAPPEDRAALLATLDPAVRAEVASLAAALDDSPAFLALDDDAPAETPATIGPYRILGEIGRGGMGIVYRAERADGEVVRQVALKLAGGRLFAPEAERRFIRERQILAQLAHPHIVALLDGGVANGQRYLVMELVEGTPITEWARGRPLDARLRLLVDVCSAIAYAHQRLVLHRDLKPGNILVTADGQAKVLDFGIAQVLRGDTAHPAPTETALRPLSMACASPEQLRGERLSLASDVYSLGVLLSEVATGVNPQFRPDATFDQNLQRALVDDPPPPSRVVRSLPRDLDAIVGKAMAKKAEARYASVTELQADLQRLLAGQPVLAIPPRAGYVLRRFVARNKGLTAVAVVLALAVAGGSAFYVRQARIEQRRFEDARRLVHSVVFDIQPKLETLPGTLALRQTLIAETLKYLEAVSRDVGNNVPLLRELSSSYAQLAFIHGDAVASNLGDRVAAAREFARATELMARALAVAGSDPEVLAEASALDRRRSDFALQGEQRDDAVRLAASALAHADRSLALAPQRPAGLEARAMAWFAQGRAVMGKDPDAALAFFGRAKAHFASTSAPNALPREAGLVELYMSDVLIKRGDAARGPAHAREALRLAQAALGRAPSDQRARHDVATAAGQLAAGLFNANDPAAAEEYFAMAVDMRDQIAAADPENVRAIERLALSKGRFGTILARAGKFAAAQAAIERAIALYEGLQATGRLAPTMEGDFAETLAHFGDYHRRRSNAPAACAAFARSARLLQVAAARQPLASTRQRQLDYDLEELKSCGTVAR